MNLSLFDVGKPRFKIDKPIRLIELFGGYGSQALALKYLGVPFEHWALSEWAIPSILAYAKMHEGEEGIGETKDYSEGLSDDYIRFWLSGGRISANYNDPISDEKIARMPIDKLREIYNAMQKTRNAGSICKLLIPDKRGRRREQSDSESAVREYLDGESDQARLVRGDGRNSGATSERPPEREVENADGALRIIRAPRSECGDEGQRSFGIYPNFRGDFARGGLDEEARGLLAEGENGVLIWNVNT